MTAHESNTVAHELNCTLLLDYKFTLPTLDIHNTRFVGLEMYAVGKWLYGSIRNFSCNMNCTS